MVVYLGEKFHSSSAELTVARSVGPILPSGTSTNHALPLTDEALKRFAGFVGEPLG